MSDEAPRPTPGSTPQRRPSGAPSWWAELERADLPEGGRAPAAGRATRPQPAPGRRPPLTPRPAPSAPRLHVVETVPGEVAPASSRLRSLGATLVVIAAAVVIAWFGVGGGDLRTVLVVVLVFGVPTAVAAGVASVMGRRGG